MIDAHLHFPGDHPQTVAVMEELDIKMLNISVAHVGRNWRASYVDRYRNAADQWPERFAWCTSFDLPTTAAHDQAYADGVIATLEKDFEAGAIACKVWKNVGMEIKDEQGQHILIDAPVFAPIFEYLQGKGVTLMTHIAEPMACWLPLDPKSPHYRYYSRNPQWHMYGRTDIPSHAELMTSRDHIIQRYPRLRMVGAHLGSQEHDLNEVASRLDRYDNYAVDISARLMDLVAHGREPLRAFIIKYADRVLYSTDHAEAQSHSELTPEQRTASAYVSCMKRKGLTLARARPWNCLTRTPTKAWICLLMYSNASWPTAPSSGIRGCRATGLPKTRQHHS